MSTAAQVNERLAKLTSAGVSVWLDQIRRSLVEGGELGRMVEEESLRGVTANPSIFEKAILGSDDYHEDLEALAREKLEPQEIYDRLAQRDVQLACEVLASVHEESGGRDGFVSLEVAPEIAYDTERTLEMARVYWKAVDRSNLMIKIPGPPRGCPAIEQAIFEGINVNVTLLFSVEAYARVAEAYLRGLERRQEKGLSLNVNSVASFFVSRVDSNVDKKLEALGRSDLAGTAALANARAAYRRFKEIFSGGRWEALRHGGAAVQRPLWASTGTKNPSYSDTKYVDGLVGPHTVNTMPMATLHACADHLEVTGPTVEIDPADDLAALAAAGIDMTEVTDELLEDGVKQFETAMNTLLAGIEEQRGSRRHRAAGHDRGPPVYRGPGSGRRADRPGRNRERGPARVAPRRLIVGRPRGSGDRGSAGLADPDRGHRRPCQRAAVLRPGVPRRWLHRRRPSGYGGLFAGPRGDSPLVCSRRCIFRRAASPGARLDPSGCGQRRAGIGGPGEDAVHRVLQVRRHDRDPFPLPPLCLAGQAQSVRGHHRSGKPTGAAGLRGGASPHVPEPARYRRALQRAVGVRPRPGGSMGVDVEVLLHGAQVAEQACAHYDSSASNSGLWLGAALGELARQGRDKLTFIVSRPIESFGLWVEQLVAESTGKHGRGILPVADEPLGEPEMYGDDRVFVHLRDPDNADEDVDGAVEKLAMAGHPAITLSTHGPTDLGRIFFLAEFAVAVAGWALEINPFDQPNVQEAKDNTKRVLESGAVPAFDSADDIALRELLADAAPPHYVALMGYLPYSRELDDAISELRATIRESTGAAVTFGYGPRFLHSTGQLHKGGPPTGRFLQLVNDPSQDVAIPGRWIFLRHADRRPVGR